MSIIPHSCELCCSEWLLILQKASCRSHYWLLAPSPCLPSFFHLLSSLPTFLKCRQWVSRYAVFYRGWPAMTPGCSDCLSYYAGSWQSNSPRRRTFTAQCAAEGSLSHAQEPSVRNSGKVWTHSLRVNTGTPSIAINRRTAGDLHRSNSGIIEWYKVRKN